LTGIFVLVAAASTPLRAAENVGPLVYTYQAVHAKYGPIGTYTNTVTAQDGVTTVQTRVRLRVRIMGITAHREEADRTETWKGGKLVAFLGVTTTNGDKVEIKGEAKGNAFVITTPAGTINAPADIRVSNPWSDNFIGATAMMSADSGKVQSVSVEPGVKVTTQIGTAMLNLTSYDIVSKPAYQIWLDGRRIPVMFNDDDESGMVTFTLLM
jgi:hypothetical protein